MRIIAGTKRGMKLFSPQTRDSRPITDRVKESLFNVLCKYDLPNGKVVADLFCGVGSLGLEALSRGAEFVGFVEKDSRIIAILKKNIEKAGFGLHGLEARPATARSAVTSATKVIRGDAFKIGAPVAGHGTSRTRARDEQKYDLIFVDPPYSATRETKEGSPLGELLALLSEQSAVDGIVVVRTERRTELLEQYGPRLPKARPTEASGGRSSSAGQGFEVIERRQWGTMAVTILQLKRPD